MIRKYVYLISYHHSKGYGTISINLNRKINSTEQIAEIHKYIENENNYEKVGIISYQLLCKKWVRKEVLKYERRRNV